MVTAREAQVDKDVKKKLKLESTFKPEVLSVFRSILNGFKSTVSITGVAPDARLYHDRWSAILKKHYERVQKQFKISVSLENKQNATDEALTEKLSFDLDLWVNENGKIVSDLITQTTHNNMNDAVNEARQMLLEDQGIVDNRSLSLLATRLLKRKFRGRVEGIISSETQSVAEKTKQATADVIDEGVQQRSNTQESVVTKSWHTVGDTKVRETHRIANRQNRRVKDVYDVGNQKLMFPGDRSFGASLKEIAHCRCSSVLFVSGDMLNFHQ